MSPTSPSIVQNRRKPSGRRPVGRKAIERRNRDRTPAKRFLKKGRMPDFVSHCGNRPRNIRRRRPRSSNLLRVYANVHRERTVLALTKVTRLICILDEGCDLGHPDLKFEAAGINLGSMSGDGSPTGDHGTACAGIAAAIVDNAL